MTNYAINVLFCSTYASIPASSNYKFKPNHFVPLFKKKSQISIQPWEMPIQGSSGALVAEQTNEATVKKKSVLKNTPNNKITTYYMVDNKKSSESSCELPKRKLPLESSTTSTAKEIKIESVPVDTNLPPNTEKSTDIATFRKQLSLAKVKEKVELKIHMIENVFKPGEGYIFPKWKNGRAFSYEWLKNNEHICYSQSRNGGYCLVCVLFADDVKDKHNIIVLYTEPLCEKTPLYEAFVQNYILKKTIPIDVLTNQASANNIRKNTEFLQSIIDVIIHLGRQGLPFRGHHDSYKYYPPIGLYSIDKNVGNFVETVNLIVRHGDKPLENHLRTCPRNARYMSAPIQNELIELCGKDIQYQIVSKIKAAKFYAILCDEAMDASSKEQLAFVIRFVNEMHTIQEEFLRFIYCDEGVAGIKLANHILSAIAELGLDILNCRDQGYDGAGNMSGHINGCSAHILSECPKSLYTHCFNHRLAKLSCTKDIKHS